MNNSQKMKEVINNVFKKLSKLSTQQLNSKIKDSSSLLDLPLSEKERTQIALNVLPTMILRINQLSKTDKEFRESVLKLIEEVEK